MRKKQFCHIRTAKDRISLPVYADWSLSLLIDAFYSILYRYKNSEGRDQSANKKVNPLTPDRLFYLNSLDRFTFHRNGVRLVFIIAKLF